MRGLASSDNAHRSRVMPDFTPWSEAEDAALVAAAENAERDITGRILWRQIVTLPDRNSVTTRCGTTSRATAHTFSTANGRRTRTPS